MADVSFYYPPAYQRAPSGTSDSLSGLPASGGTGGTGAAGADGRTIINGTGAPASGQGSAGDFYLQLDGTVLWGPKTDAGWGQGGVSLVGAKGTPGSKIYRVAQLPTDASAYADGDILIDDQGNLAPVNQG